jgi:DNA-binding transcriptional LysR family regulator
VQTNGDTKMHRICYDDIYIFTKVAEYKSITAASELLGMSKQTVSRKISKLEDSLNILLIARTTRSFMLTKAGNEYYRHCANIFNEVEKANDVITEFHTNPSGTVKLGIPDYFPFCYFSNALTRYLELNPSINVHISYHSKESDLISNNIDIAFRIGTLNDSSMIARKLGTMKFVFVASKEYIVKRGIPEKLKDLNDHNIIEVDNFIFHDRCAHKQNLKSNNFYFAKEFALSGFGVTILPECVVTEDNILGKLVILEDKTFFVEHDVNIVYLASRHLPKQVRALIEHLVSYNNGIRYNEISGF